MDLYKILEINTNASNSEIKQAYIKLAKLYHPDKNKSVDAHDKFIQIHYAYEILFNNKIKKEYIEMNNNDKNNFFELLKKIMNNKLELNDFQKYFCKLNQYDFDYIKSNFNDIIQKINIIELIELFKNGIILKKNVLIYSESETEMNNENYYYNLPIYLQKINNLDIKIDLNIEFIDIINNNKRKIKIKRTVNNKIIISSFMFNLSHPYIVFNNYGDIDKDNYGNLIIKLILPQNYYWDNDILFFDYPITLYQLIYGIELDNLNWIPYQQGFIINRPEYKNINFAIKLYLNYENSVENHDILKNNFNKIF